MISTLSLTLLLGLLPQQKEPQDPAKSTQPSTLDEAKAAAVTLSQASGYQFDVEVKVNPVMLPRPVSTDGTQPKGVVYAKEEMTLKLDGHYQSGQPAHIKGEDVEVYRSGTKTAYRLEGSGEKDDLWRLADSAAGPVPPASDAADKDARERQSALWAACNMPLPHELLQDLSSKVTKMDRLLDEGGLLTKDKIIFVGQMKPECIKNCTTNIGDVGTVSCLLRIVTNKDRKIERIEIESHCASTGEKPTDKPVEPSADKTQPKPDMYLVYKISDVNDEEVEVPEEIRKMLASK